MVESATNLPQVWRAPVAERSEQLKILVDICLDDLLRALGVSASGWASYPLRHLLRHPAQSFAEKVVSYDDVVSARGLSAGGVWALERFVRDIKIYGAERVPESGPVLIVSNHPGLADTIALFAATPRRDLRVIAAENPFLRALPGTSRYLMYVSDIERERLALIRNAGRHLKRGGAILTFPGGRIEPDPAALSGASDALASWSPSMRLFTRLAHGLSIVPVVVSGVVSPRAVGHPLTILRRRREDRECLAAILQAILPSLQDVAVHVSFGEPVQTNLLSPGETRHAILSGMHSLIEEAEKRPLARA